MKRGFVLSLSALLAAVALTPTAASARVDQAAPAAKLTQGAKLANQVLNAKKFARGVKATRQILALSGVATVGDGQEIVTGAKPLSDWKMTARETVLMTRGARVPIVSLGEIARRMSQMGAKGEYGSWKQAFPDMVREWIYSAQARPKQPLSQPALFVSQMQLRQASKVSPFDRQSNPAKMRLTALEAHIVLANLERVIKPGTPPEELPEPEEEEDEELFDEDNEAPVMGSVAQAPTGGPCASVKSALESLGPIGSGVADVVIGDASSSAIEAYADSLKDGAGDAVGTVMTSLDVIDRIIRTAAFAANVEVVVLPAYVNGDNFRIIQNGRVHKPLDGSRKHVWFVAGVGLDDFAREALASQLSLAKDQPFQESMKACLDLHGITIPDVPYGALAEEMAEWDANWTPLWNSNEVRWYAPRRVKEMKRLDDSSVYTLFKVGVKWEDPKDHRDKYSLELISDWNAKVEISAQQPPSPNAVRELVTAIVTNGQEGGYVGPIAEFSESLFRAVFKPAGTGTLRVEEHVENPCLNFGRSGSASPSC